MCFNSALYRKFSTLVQPHFCSSFNSKIRDSVHRGQNLEALRAYAREPFRLPETSRFTFPSLLKACVSLSSLYCGRIIHGTVIATGLHYDPYIITSLINLYVKCGSLEDAEKLFVNVPEKEALARDVTVWNSMIDGYFRYGLVEEGIAQLLRMQQLKVKLDGYSLSILLGTCKGHLGYLKGKQIHGHVVRNSFDDDYFVMTALINMYSCCGAPTDAWSVFQKLEDRNSITTWNAMIGGFCENGMWKSALKLYILAKQENCEFVSTTFSSVFTGCSQGEDADVGKQIHCDAIKMGFQSDPYVCTSLLKMYAKCILLADAEKVFSSTQKRELELWNALISAYVGNGCSNDALTAYNEMRLRVISSDSYTLSTLLASCGMIGFCKLGRALHAEVIKRMMQNDVAVQSALLTMYSKCGNIDSVDAILDTIGEMDLVAWGSIISANCHIERFEESVDLLTMMISNGVRPDSEILSAVINAIAGLENMESGCCIHGYVIKSGFATDAFVGSCLIEMYSKCGQPKMAGNAFSDTLLKNLVVWNSIISCYCRNNLPELSIGLLPQIVQHNLFPNSVTISSVLVAISSVAASLKGKTVHGYQIRLEIPADIQVSNSLIDMYVKCGCLRYAQHVFENMPRRNLITWNAMIAGYGAHGESLKALDLFNKLIASGITPDNITFLSLISSCNHSGMVEKGLSLFHLMRGYKIEPGIEHYVNIVDLLGRAGCLDDAFSFIKEMPIEPGRSVWLSLLSACRIHRNVRLAELAAQNLLQMDPSTGSNYVQLLNLYVEVGYRDKAAKLRASMKQNGLEKTPGCSWIEVKNKVDVFFSGNSASSSMMVEIHVVLDTLISNLVKTREDVHYEVEAF